MSEENEPIYSMLTSKQDYPDANGWGFCLCTPTPEFGEEPFGVVVHGTEGYITDCSQCAATCASFYYYDPPQMIWCVNGVV